MATTRTRESLVPDMPADAPAKSTAWFFSLSPSTIVALNVGSGLERADG
jgi:hypothetical protein